MIVHDLDGCAPTPLAHYLKALGILRLVAEQADSQARGWWDGDRFRLATSRSFDELLSFFMDDYRPTPLLAPWNGASGFFRTWDAKKKKLRESKNGRALQSLISQEAERWKPFQETYRIAVEAVGSVLKEVNVDKLPGKERGRLLIVPKGEGPVFPVADKDNDKAIIQRAMARACSDRGLYRSAIVDMGEDFGYPSLWGSGGNDGAIDFTARYFENLEQALIDADKQTSRGWLLSALRTEPAKALLTKAAGKVGQFLPGGAGGANSVNGPGSQHDTLLNPWDFIFMLEGAVLFTAHATRRLGTLEQSRAAAPFAVGAQGAGYASAADSDESARGEQWMPLWAQPMALDELRRLLAEGRAQIGAHSVREPLDLARAVARLGTARGIAAFQRYGYIERNGQSNLAVPLGRFVVPDHISPRLACLDDLDAWLPRLRREARNNNASNRLKLTERRLADALFAVIQHPDEPSRWQSVLLALAEIEAVQITGSGYQAGPVPKLRPEWVEAANDNSPEFRLALSFALQASAFKRESGMPLNPIQASIRRHWLPLDREKPWKFATTGTGSQTRLQAGADAVMQGRRGIDDASAMVERRLIEAAQRGQRHLPLQAATRAAADPADLATLIAGAVDMDRTLALGRALMALDRELWPQQFISLSRPQHTEWPDDAWFAIRLAMLPWPLPDGRRIGVDPAILRRLESGDAATAVELALRRLRAAGIQSTVRVASVSPEIARLWAAALAFPISQHTAKAFVRRLDPHSLMETA
ncbi:MAG: type I-U CRISPR-associated protein Csx17 [Betaproteobacteria bacterium RIFCSPLOWO2_12_FULL_65_14]|nr:MAG: type I-U CRISPR-associated protein Csx17 [Betaproteobacteria bacterium RIFCSPLOWO2_12_FULL_65_14]